MTISHTASISTQARQYYAILSYVTNTLTVENAKTTKQIYQALGESVRNEMQVRDALRSMHLKGLISRIKVGGSVQYFRNPETGMINEKFSAPTNDANAPDRTAEVQTEHRPEPSVISIPDAPASAVIPEITIIGNTIVIAHPKCKITLEV